jgi:hypothetical protein
MKINFKNCTIHFSNKKYNINPVGTAAQELILTKGLENWVKERINNG